MITQEEVQEIAKVLAPLININQKEWLTPQEVMKEFNIKTTLFYDVIKETNQDPLPYSTFGDTKKLVNRDELNKWLRRRMRNA
jgi:hypothetical protein